MRSWTKVSVVRNGARCRVAPGIWMRGEDQFACAPFASRARLVTHPAVRSTPISHKSEKPARAYAGFYPAYAEWERNLPTRPQMRSLRCFTLRHGQTTCEHDPHPSIRVRPSRFLLRRSRFKEQRILEFHFFTNAILLKSQKWGTLKVVLNIFDEF